MRKSQSRFWLSPLILLLSTTVLNSNAQIASPEVNLDYATYVGTALDAGVTQFLGMRFAAPPLGNLRWRAPADPLVETGGPIQASKHGPICYNLGVAFDPNATTFSDDCLFIDVYTPSHAHSKRSKPLPVWFFIQGGGYVSNSNANYNGTGVIVESGLNVVVVNFNYRVGAFGFLASERVAKDGQLNAGLLDQRKALFWVRKHISKFGGDPNHVVIHGVSAGGGSVTHHMTAFGGRDEGLFVGAIGESVFWPREAPVSQLEFQFDLFAAAAGCSDATDQMACLRAQNTSTLVAANIAHPFPGRTTVPNFYYTPTIDGDFIRDNLYNLFRQNKFTPVPLMIGDDDDEGTAFAANAQTPEDVISFLTDNYPQLTADDATTINQLYPLLPPLPNHAPFFPSAAAAYGESTFTCPSNFIAGLIGARKNVWNYRFSVVQPDRAASGLGVDHTSELPAVFGPPFIPGGNSTTFATTNAPIVPVLMNYWISFVRSLNPNTHKFSSAPEWAEFDSKNQRRIKFVLNDTHVESIPADEDTRCAFWNDIGARLEQ
ncbi:Carboxylic ester hydrolase [Mycena venus]|uniref:Carboxylic ester hydrolase n=1 Tax=Mycena venus TaxID=2733690 RepID=A0A8H6YDQ2_9AGAR|nr:Carboxylic ester hydrolase [Mycena venus]